MESFDRFWAAYPNRKGDSSKYIARKKFVRLCAEGVEPDAMIEGAKAYAEQESKNIGTRYIAMASTWLNQRRWEDYAAHAKVGTVECQRVFIQIDTPQWRAWDEWRRRNEGRGWPQTEGRLGGKVVKGWWFIMEWPPQMEAAE